MTSEKGWFNAPPKCAKLPLCLLLLSQSLGSLGFKSSFRRHLILLVVLIASDHPKQPKKAHECSKARSFFELGSKNRPVRDNSADSGADRVFKGYFNAYLSKWQKCIVFRPLPISQGCRRDAGAELGPRVRMVQSF